MKLTLNRYYEDNKNEKWITVAVVLSSMPGHSRPSGEPVYLAMMVGKNPTGTPNSLHTVGDTNDGMVRLEGLWFTQEGIALCKINAKAPTVLRMVKMLVVEDPHAPDVVEQLGSVSEEAVF